MEKDVVFLKDAQSADVGDGVPRGCLLEDFPFQCVSYSLSCKSVNVVGEAGTRLFRVSDVIVMPTPSALLLVSALVTVAFIIAKTQKIAYK